MKTKPHLWMGSAMTIRITDVAAYAKVSPSVVSRVLHNSGYVSDEKKAAVELALKELGYIPNQVAQGLKRQKTTMIGHLLPAVYPNPFFAGVSYGVDTEADRQGYHVLTLLTYNDPAREARLIDDFISRMVDGVVITGGATAVSVKKLRDNGIRSVLVERTGGLSGLDKVLVDNIHGAKSAVQHLIDHNHRRIACIGAALTGDVEQDRYNGYTAALAEAGIPFHKSLVRLVNAYEPSEGYRAAEAILAVSPLPTAIFTTSDLLAIGILQCLYAKGLQVPAAISLVSYDDSMAPFMSPPLTSVANPVYELGRSAVQLILDRIRKEDSVTKTLTLDTQLVIRQSVRKLE